MIYDYETHKHKMQLAAAERAIAEIARKNFTTVNEVRQSIADAIEAAFNKPNGKELFSKIPSEAEIPTPEEFIAWAGARIV